MKISAWDHKFTSRRGVSRSDFSLHPRWASIFPRMEHLGIFHSSLAAFFASPWWQTRKKSINETMEKKKTYIKSEWNLLVFFIFNNLLSLKFSFFLSPSTEKALSEAWKFHRHTFPHPSLSHTAGFFLFPPVFISIQRIKKRERRRSQKTTDKENPSERVSCFSLFFFLFLSGSFYEGEQKKMFFFQFQVIAKASFIKYSTSIMSWENTEAKILRIERTTFFCLILKYAN